MEENLNKDILAIQFKAEYTETSGYIYFVFFLDKNNIKIIDKILIISKNKKLSALINSKNNILETYKSLVASYSINARVKSESDKVLEEVNKLLEDKNNIQTIIESINSGKIIPIIDIFSDTLNMFMEDHIGIYDVQYKFLSLENFHSFIDNLNEDVDTSTYHDILNNHDVYSSSIYGFDEEEIINNKTIVETALLVSPIKGTSILDILVGEKIILSIDNYLFDESMNSIGTSSKNDKVFIIADIMKKEFDSGVIKLVLRLSNEHYSIIEETEPIKIRIYNPDIDHSSQRIEEEEESEISFADKFMNFKIIKVALYGVGIIGLILTAYIFYITNLKN